MAPVSRLVKGVYADRVQEMLEEIKEEAARLDRSLSWIVQRAWKIARVEIKRLPSVDDILEDEEQEQSV